MTIGGFGPDALEVIIADDGPGIQPDRIAAMLRPFARGHNSGEGVGLGLAIAQEIAELHGGEVILENGDIGLIARLLVRRGLSPLPP